MRLKELSLVNYRNYAKLDIQFSSQINLLLGENAQGKTNLLEAIYVLAMARSHRTTNDKELIAWSADFAKISGVVEKKHGNLPLEIILSQKGKKAKLNHIEQKKLSDYLGNLNIILFAPEDLALVKGAPSVRRKFLDMELGQISPTYLYHLVQYQRILKQRNQYLKQLAFKQEKDLLYLDVLSEQLVGHGAEVIKRRILFLAKLEKWAQSIHQVITQGAEQLNFQYQTAVKHQDLDVKIIAEHFLLDLEKNRKREIDQHTTLIGPHRDDIKFIVNEQNIQTYGSQGQQRTTALSLKLAEIDLIKEEVDEYPILLLDDVLSELDDSRQTHLLKSIQGKVQTFLTTTSLDGIYQNIIQSSSIYEIDQGKIKMEREAE